MPHRDFPKRPERYALHLYNMEGRHIFSTFLFDYVPGRSPPLPVHIQASLRANVGAGAETCSEVIDTDDGTAEGSFSWGPLAGIWRVSTSICCDRRLAPEHIIRIWQATSPSIKEQAHA